MAQLTACGFLVRSCERALFDLRCALGEAADPQEVRAGLRAIELLQEVLEGWRETRATLASAGLAVGWPTFTARSWPLTRR
jgi:hypothetical protein